MGDFNVNYKNKKDHSEFKELMAAQGFDQLVKTATRTTRDSSTLIDLIYTNKKSLIRSITVIPLSIGDHDCVSCIRKHIGQKLSPRVITCRNYTNYNQNDFVKELNNLYNIDIDCKIPFWSVKYQPNKWQIGNVVNDIFS